MTAHDEIEHYIAKTIDPDLAFDWENLLPACRLCNGAKSNQDHQGQLLKPDAEDPEPYFWIDPNNGELEPHPALSPMEQLRASETIRLCNLQRGALCDRRYQMLLRVGRWMNRVGEAGSLGSDDLAEKDELLSPRTEYKLVIRHVLIRRGLGALAEKDRKRFGAGP